MKKITALLLSVLLLLSLAACAGNEPKETTAPTTPAATEPVEEMEHYDLNETDLATIGELLANRQADALCKIQLDGLCTPVVLELEGTDLVSISAYGITAFVDTNAADYASIYGNLWPVIYDHEGLIFLNIWHDDIGYSCVLCPDNSYIENYPGEEFSVMTYVDEEEQMVQYQFALKFLGIEQWDTGPIDMAVSRDDFYYSIDYAQWSEAEYTVTAGETFTISDCYELDDIFRNAKANGLYPEFETLDELLAYNAQRFTDDPSLRPDSTREEVSYFDELYAAYDYDQNRNLIAETFYERYCGEYFTKTHTYDEKNREVAGVWSFQGEEAYRYTNTYDSKDRLAETLWYQGDKEVERFTYTYDKKGGYTETFSQNGEKKYTYSFDDNGELTAHSIYMDGKEIKTKDVKSLVKTELLTDIWFPFMDNGALHFNHRYDGTVPTETPAHAEVTTAADGSYILIQEGVDEEFGEAYRHEYHYSTDDKLLRAIHIWEGVESYRDEYQYDSNGLCIEQITYHDSEQSLSQKHQYNEAGQRIRTDRVSTEPGIEYIYEYDENGMEVSREITYTTKTETYRYNDLGLLVETVYYADGEEFAQDTYDYDSYGYVLPSTDTYQYVYSPEGILQEIWIIGENWAAGAAQLRSRTVYVTQENAWQLQEIMRNELSWF